MEKHRQVFDFTFRQNEGQLKRAAERTIGRFLKEDETIVYLDGDNTNLERFNLYVTDKPGLERLNSSMKSCFQGLLNEKRIGFNSFKGVYEIENAPVRKIVIHKNLAEVSELKPKIEKVNESNCLILISIEIEI